MKQTALEWLYEEFTKTNYLTEDEFYMIFNQAKEMEKEQIMDAYEIGFADAWDDARYDDEPKHAGAEQYYNETFIVP
jgi:TRAP-type uncharacterized transport system substrate-binding protein